VKSARGGTGSWRITDLTMRGLVAAATLGGEEAAGLPLRTQLKGTLE